MPETMSRAYALERMRILAEEVEVCAAAYSAAQRVKPPDESAEVAAFANAARRFLTTTHGIE